MTVVAIHQPQYLPYLGFYHKIQHCDLFVVLDDVQFQKGGFQNRNRIKTHDSWQWITVPVLHDSGQLINAVRINNDVPWPRKHWNAVTTNYSTAPFFAQYGPSLQRILLDSEWTALSELNISLMNWVLAELGIKRQIERSSTIETTGQGTARLVEICQELRATHYLSGPGGRAYLDPGAFQNASIDLIWQDFTSPVYSQQFPDTGFEKDMSVIDALFCCGPQTKTLLD